MIRLIPFIYSSTIAYLIEVGNLYMRLFYEDEEMDVVATPYLTVDLLQLQYAQIADVMRIVHSSYAPRKLSRVATTAFTLEEIDFRKGPFLIRNDLIDPVTPSTTTLACDETAVGAIGTLTASENVFLAGHVGALFKLIHKRTVTQVSISGAGTSDELEVKGSAYFVTSGTWLGKCILQREDNNSGDWTDFRTYEGRTSGARNDSLSWTEKEDNIKYRIYSVGISTGFSATLNVFNPDKEGIVRVLSVVDSKNCVVEVLQALELTTATTRWAEGAWSDVQDYPSSITFSNDRCIYFGKSELIPTVWLSKVGDYDNFEEGVNDDDAFSLPITTQEEPCWIESLESLLLGTVGEEWKLGTNKLNTPLTPTNFTANSQTTCGSSQIQPIRVGTSLLFVDKVGRKVREMTYSASEEKYVAPDLTTLAEHITYSGITSIARQKNPDSIIWMTLGDGSLISMTYERDQNVIAWSRHPLGGDGIALCVCVIPGATEDLIYLSVERTIDGIVVNYIEKMAPRVFTAIEDAFFVDCGITFTSVTATSTITGLEHLEGEVVKTLGTGPVIGNGIVLDDATVSSGQITAKLNGTEVTVTKANVGLPYTSLVQPMRLIVNSGGGSSMGSVTRVDELVVSFLNTWAVKYGSQTSDLYDIDFSDVRWENTASLTGTFTGDVVMSMPGGFSVYNPIIISTDSPLPCTVRCLVARISQTGR